MRRRSWFWVLFWIVFIIGIVILFNHIKHLPNGSICKIEYEIRKMPKTPIDQLYESSLVVDSTPVDSGTIVTDGAKTYQLDSEMKFHVSKVGPEFCHLTFDNEVKRISFTSVEVLYSRNTEMTNVIKLAEYLKQGDPRLTNKGLSRLNRLGYQQVYLLRESGDMMYVYIVRLIKRGVD